MIYSLFSKKHGCYLFYDDSFRLIVTACLFSRSIFESGHTFKIKREKKNQAAFINTELVEHILDTDGETINTSHNKLVNFLNWAEHYSTTKNHTSVFNHHNFTNDLLNYYVNEVLIGQEKKGTSSVAQSVMSLRYYYNWLAAHGLCRTKNFNVKNEFRQQARDNTSRRKAEKYLTPELRSILYQNTNSIRDELLLKNAGDLGLRTSENQGLVLNDYYLGKTRHDGLKTLWLQMNTNFHQMEFDFYLQGQFVKAPPNEGGSGKGRTLKISRDLLFRMEEYYKKERPETNKTDALLLNTDTDHNPGRIATYTGSRKFAQVRKKVLKLQEDRLLDQEGQKLDEDHTYHVLRHSFGTDKFYAFCKENNIQYQDATVTSSAYLAVARLLGHTTTGKFAAQTTREYIRGCDIKKKYP